MDKDTDRRIRFLECLATMNARERLHLLSIETTDELRILAGLAPQVRNGLLLILSIRAVMVLREETTPQAASKTPS